MSKYVLEMETEWEGEFRPIGSVVSVDAESPTDAIARVNDVGLRGGVLYRLHITGPEVDARTTVFTTPALPTQPFFDE